MMRGIVNRLAFLGGPGGLLAVLWAFLKLTGMAIERWGFLTGTLLYAVAAFAVTMLWFTCSPKMANDAEKERLFSWLSTCNIALFLPIPTFEHLQVQLAQFMESISFGYLSWPQQAQWVITSIWSVALAISIGTVAYALRHYSGFDRAVLVAFSGHGTLLISSLFYPGIFDVIWMIVGGFAVALNWGGPIGESARNLLAAVMRALKIRRAQRGQTSIEVPQAGTDITKL